MGANFLLYAYALKDYCCFKCGRRIRRGEPYAARSAVVELGCGCCGHRRQVKQAFCSDCHPSVLDQGWRGLKWRPRVGD